MNEEFKKKLSKSGVDVVGAINRFSENEEIYEKYLRIFPDDEAFTTLVEAYVEGDYERLRKSAHTLKGTSANFGIRFVCDPCAQLSDELKSGEYSNVDRLVSDINSAYAKLVDILK